MQYNLVCLFVVDVVYSRQSLVVLVGTEWYMVVPVQKRVVLSRVAEVGSLSARAKMAIQIFVNCVFAIFATNPSFLQVIANLHI